MIKEAIIKLSKKQDLAYAEAEAVMDEIMSGQATPVQMSSYLTALSLKGETIDEITASAAGMRAHCIKLLHNLDVLEIVGTGGDGSNSFNISTTSSLVIAAGGVPVAKHGNRAASSKSGAADVLEALGVKITLTPERSAEILKKINICFLFAQNYHIAMKYVAPIRKELGIRTVFNILGPLSNPAGANMELMGVYDQSLVEPLAQVMANLGVDRGMVVYGQDSLDEISMCAPTSVCEIRDGKFTSYEITPEQFGYERCEKGALTGGTPAENAEITKAILKGEEKGPKRQAVCLNAGAALYIAGKAASIEEGVKLAESLIDSGAALKKLEEFVEETNK
ncbi:anthranilate phosphoribosyltransferase [Blautia wexlerae]|jgi:anthranilate phosphoribosyltransferase|uniref:anthranilate phosphoribosyltransferase n=1 Tax=Blautia TaxID=572511 RepID=UPI000E548C24|nr:MULTISPECIES: anthranilate phosphoribosyltransferase [Blautia]RHQ38037.1 anthranilate phosphoribosyltransferase [Ruminococcus sp. AF25-28AC]MCB5687370.1 anthranilate phosphoribosyltransferase [Blautia wexlerae]NSD02728.1 anthranilate phosphoribosyltransferase [Blautia wexlerae]NSE94041.1 anthranilate phosphoribosyltransferase [Blautia wexlerae]NSF15665.1 anthranilate phosphoribosyltransferase [Blautia wexlerae]